MSPLSIPLGGKDRPILYSVAAIEEIEAATGKTIIGLLSVPNFDVGLSGLVTMLHIGIKHGGETNLARERIRTMVDRDFDAGKLTIQKLIEIVQRGLVRSSTFKSQVAPEVLAELAELEKEGEGDRPTESASGDTASNHSSTS
jgi:hypothetical protein